MTERLACSRSTFSCSLYDKQSVVSVQLSCCTVKLTGEWATLQATELCPFGGSVSLVSPKCLFISGKWLTGLCRNEGSWGSSFEKLPTVSGRRDGEALWERGLKAAEGMQLLPHHYRWFKEFSFQHLLQAPRALRENLNVTSHYSDLTSPFPPPPSSHFCVKNPALKHTLVSPENQSLLPQTTKHLKWQHQGGSPCRYICTCCQLWNLMIVLTQQLPLACFQGPLQQAANCSGLVPPSHTPCTKAQPLRGSIQLTACLPRHSHCCMP